MVVRIITNRLSCAALSLISMGISVLSNKGGTPGGRHSNLRRRTQVWIDPIDVIVAVMI